jgi:hypothetical protein
MCVSVTHHTSAYVCMRQHTSAVSAYVCIRWLTCIYVIRVRVYVRVYVSVTADICIPAVGAGVSLIADMYISAVRGVWPRTLVYMYIGSSSLRPHTAVA